MENTNFLHWRVCLHYCPAAFLRRGWSGRTKGKKCQRNNMIFCLFLH